MNDFPSNVSNDFPSNIASNIKFKMFNFPTSAFRCWLKKNDLSLLENSLDESFFVNIKI